MVVKEGDQFDEIVMDGRQSLNFKPLAFNDNPIIGAFAVVLYDDGGMQYETMTKKDIDVVRTGYSKMSTGQSWTKSFSEMARKTVLRRLCKHIEIDFENKEQKIAYDESADVEFKKKEPVKATSSLDFDNDFIDVTPEKIEEKTDEDNKEAKV
jgi:recombination protein RecT